MIRDFVAISTSFLSILCAICYTETCATTMGNLFPQSHVAGAFAVLSTVGPVCVGPECGRREYEGGQWRSVSLLLRPLAAPSLKNSQQGGIRAREEASEGAPTCPDRDHGPCGVVRDGATSGEVLGAQEEVSEGMPTCHSHGAPVGTQSRPPPLP